LRVSDVAYLKVQAARCRRLAEFSAEDQIRATLNAMADEYEAKARQQEAGSDRGVPPT
jgi:hypothetical protein